MKNWKENLKGRKEGEFWNWGPLKHLVLNSSDFIWSKTGDKFLLEQVLDISISEEKHDGVTGGHWITGESSATRSLASEICGLTVMKGCILICKDREYNWSYTFMILHHYHSRGLGIKEIFHLKSSYSNLCWRSSQDKDSLHKLLLTR